MRRAVAQARKGLWATAPNPCVGALLTLHDEVVAAGWHTAYGKPHAEVEALAAGRGAGADLTRCTLWVTLEPCNHYGKTPPCTKAIIEAGIPRVVVGCLDPNPDVRGGGVATLREAGVEVIVGVAEQDCLDLIADFLIWKHARRPYVFLKLASTLDGRIATRTGHSKWISGGEARRQVHALRGRVQAVMVGGRTFREDNPRLTCRNGAEAEGKGGSERQPLAVVATSRLPRADREPSFLVAERPGETIFFTSEEQASSETAGDLAALGCAIWPLPRNNDGTLDIGHGLRRLFSERGCHYLLCEGGGSLGMDLLRTGLADELRLYVAPKILGDAQARPLFSGREPLTMADALGLRIVSHESVGQDVLLVLRPGSGAAENGRRE